MYKRIIKLIKKYDTIFIARHIGVDPDALSSQLALKESIQLTFPNKKVFAVGNGSSKFHYIGKLDKVDECSEKSLLIVLDTPDRKRIDFMSPDKFSDSIKIDHHPFVEKFASLEWIDDKSSSTCQIIIDLLFHTKLKMNQEIARKLYIGLVTDSNRFAFKSSTARTFSLVSRLLKKYPLDIENIYQQIYMRPLSEVRLQGYISQNLTVTDNGVAYIKLTPDIMNKFGTDVGAAGNMINNFNYIEDFLVWLMISEDEKNEIIKINIRSRGPEINRVAEMYHGGGHKFASGARVTSMDEADCLIVDLDRICKKYIEEEVKKKNENQ